MRYVLVATLAAMMRAQPVLAQPPQFEVATLKVATPPTGNSIVINLGSLQGHRFTMGNVTLGDMMKYAYQIVSDELLVAPDWSRRDVRFDVEAVLPADSALGDLRLMLQALLAERLHLVLRHEQRVLPHLVLVVAKGGPKLPKADPGAANIGPQVRGRIAHPKMPMVGLATLLSRFERQTVVDRTGLQGDYQVKLEWAPDNITTQPDPAAPPPDRPGLFAAVQEQLGLKLESRRGPLDVLVVEQASKVPEQN